MFSRFFSTALALLLTGSVVAAEVKPIPPPGIAIADADRAALTAEVAALGREIDALRVALKAKPALLALLPDVMIFHKSVDWALRYDEFFEPKHLDAARQQLALGRQRAKETRATPRCSSSPSRGYGIIAFANASCTTASGAMSETSTQTMAPSCQNTAVLPSWR